MSEENEEEKYRSIGFIGNYYGSLSVKERSGKFFWSIENYDGFHWQEIPESLYNELIKFDNFCISGKIEKDAK